ncbi:leucyl aminopeptidase [Clostridium swellfunianum]|uniref:leucyl aminopeptidase family protein n=1 Tax=Clostridium swellfunianum TaxID=1367462 RepID=UPI00202E609A|nr:leucyl aminopeptidase [Clostridium swellfunianum]MCM0648970.1 leucyl aminopeptidase [Clostridium swellfunianum]
MLGVNDNKLYSNLLIFKFKNFSLEYPEEIREILAYSENSGDLKELEILNTLGKCDYKKVFILGLGTTEEFNSVKLMRALGSAVKSIKNSIEDLDILDNLREDFGYNIGQVLELSLYKFKGIKQKEINVKLQKVNVISSCKDEISKGFIVGNSVNFVRNLVSLPSNYVTPKYIAQQAENIAKEGNLDIKIIDKYMLEQMGMNAILYVGKGSLHSPRLVALQYFGDSSSKEITAIIGKGVTFDSGGITLKPGKGMENMVSDMAGAASVLGTMKALSKLRPKKNIIALIPTVENMPSGNAYKPGDVITTYCGKTVQVISTDAEGRLILCDAIAYAKELGATNIIDIATLTGSCSQFLGGINAGLLSNSDELANSIINTGKEVGENFWRLPNNPEYLEQLKTDSADLKNSGTSCGAIVAGLFLESFAEDVNFAHLDIAGCAGSASGSDLYDAGATGMPTRTLIELLMK